MHRIACQCAHIVNYYIFVVCRYVSKVMNLFSLMFIAWKSRNIYIYISIGYAQKKLTRIHTHTHTLPKIKKNEMDVICQTMAFMFTSFLFFSFHSVLAFFEFLLLFFLFYFIFTSYHEHTFLRYIHRLTSFFINKMWSLSSFSSVWQSFHFIRFIYRFIRSYTQNYTSIYLFLGSIHDGTPLFFSFFFCSLTGGWNRSDFSRNEMDEWRCALFFYFDMAIYLFI